MYDDVLEAELRDQLRDEGLDDDAIDEAIATMRDAGMMDAPDD